jgi:hypothetical protein
VRPSHLAAGQNAAADLFWVAGWNKVPRPSSPENQLEVAAAKETVGDSAALSITMIEAKELSVRATDADKTVIDIADHRRRLQSVTEAVDDAQDLCARARVTVQESQELLRQVDDLYRSGTRPVLRKNRYSAV